MKNESDIKQFLIEIEEHGFKSEFHAGLKEGLRWVLDGVSDKPPRVQDNSLSD